MEVQFLRKQITQQLSSTRKGLDQGCVCPPGFPIWPLTHLKLRLLKKFCFIEIQLIQASQVALVVKSSPANAGDLKRCGFDPWVGKIPWKKAWQPTPVFLPGESPWTEEAGGLQSIHRVTQSRTRLKQFSMNAHPRQIYKVVLIFAVQHSDSVLHKHTHIYTFFFTFFSIIVCYRILNIVPCTIQLYIAQHRQSKRWSRRCTVKPRATQDSSLSPHCLMPYLSHNRHLTIGVNVLLDGIS